MRPARCRRCRPMPTSRRGGGARPHHGPVVVVDAEEVERGVDALLIAGLQVGAGGHLAHVLQHVVRVAAAQQRVEEEAIGQAVGAARRVEVCRVVARRLDRAHAERDAEGAVGVALRAHGLDRAPVAEHEVVGGAQRRLRVLQPGRMPAGGVADECRDPRLVQGRPVPDAVVQALVDRGGVLGEAFRRIAQRPTALVLEHLRKVPVIEGDPGLDVLCEQCVDQPRVEVDAGFVERPAPVGLEARPGHREAVPADAEPGHQLDVVLVAVVVVVRDVAGVPVLDLAGCVRERVPDRRRATVLPDGALDLVARGCGAPGEARREAHRFAGLLWSGVEAHVVTSLAESRGQPAEELAAPEDVEGEDREGCEDDGREDGGHVDAVLALERPQGER